MMNSYIRLMRPYQWVKNSFVFTGILFSHRLMDLQLLGDVVLVFAAFSLLASSIYIINDIFDRDSDREHPKKCQRPIASGKVSILQASVLSAFLVFVGLSMTTIWVSLEATLILIAYLLLNLAYSFGLKHVVILDIFIIATGFMLRILAGTIGVDIEPSNWLLLTGMMVTLFLGFAKRRAELTAAGDDVVMQRRVLEHYKPVVLDLMIAITAASTILAYSLYTVSNHAIVQHGSDNLIYTTPFILYGMFRYLHNLYTENKGEDPAAELFRDPHIVTAGLLWVLTTMFVLL